MDYIDLMNPQPSDYFNPTVIFILIMTQHKDFYKLGSRELSYSKYHYFVYEMSLLIIQRFII